MTEGAVEDSDVIFVGIKDEEDIDNILSCILVLLPIVPKKTHFTRTEQSVFFILTQSIKHYKGGNGGSYFSIQAVTLLRDLL